MIATSPASTTITATRIISCLLRCVAITSSGVDRSALVSVQTPQVFRVEMLRKALASGDLASATDDAALVEAAGGSVGVIEAPSGNIKVTVPSDLELAAFLLEKNQ